MTSNSRPRPDATAYMPAYLFCWYCSGELAPNRGRIVDVPEVGPVRMHKSCAREHATDDDAPSITARPHDYDSDVTTPDYELDADAQARAYADLIGASHVDRSSSNRRRTRKRRR